MTDSDKIVLTLDGVKAGIISALFSFHSSPSKKNGFRPNIGSYSLSIISKKSLSWKFLKFVIKSDFINSGSIARICGLLIKNIPANGLPLNSLNLNNLNIKK